MASVRMCDGRPPPANPYLGKQPASGRTASSITAQLKTPDRRIKRSNGIGTQYGERQRSARALIAILDLVGARASNPLLQTAILYALEPSERVSVEGDAPVR